MFALKQHHWIPFLIALAFIIFVIYVATEGFYSGSADGKRPNIIIILADDMGRNDVGFHGSNQIPTPNIDALAYNGIILDRFYTQSSCTPSRTALLTGNYPIRSAMQGLPMKAGENRSIPMNMPTMPEQLKKLGYKTHLVGKWHLGAAYRSNTPTGRGFDTHFGYWNGFISYFGYVAIQEMPDGRRFSGFDLHDKFDSVWQDKGKYSTELFTQKAEEVIENHDSKDPLFLFVSHLAPHTGENGTELGVPDVNLTNSKYSYIRNPRRRLYADVVNLLDHSVGRIVKKLEENSLLENSIILFLSDNGAPVVGTYQNEGSNWPLRGQKISDFEGGVRVAATVFSPLFSKYGYVNRQLMHLTDWLPTFYAAAGGNLEDLGSLDGVNQWNVLSNNELTERSEVLLNIDELLNNSALIGYNGRYKVVNGTYWNGTFDHYYGESGRTPEVPLYNFSTVFASDANTAIKTLTKFTLTKTRISELRHETDLTWCRNTDPFISCINGCLFDLKSDPCETKNIIQVYPKIAAKLFKRIDKFYKEMIPQKIPIADVKADPLNYNGTWCTWLDDELCVKTKI